MPWRSKEYTNFKIKLKFQKIGYGDIISFVYVGKEAIHKYMLHEVPMTVYMGRIANQRKVLKWLPFQNYMSESLNIWCTCTRDKWAYSYQIWSLSNPVAGRGVHSLPQTQMMPTPTLMHHGQSIIVKVIWLINQMSQKVHITCLNVKCITHCILLWMGNWASIALS